MKSKPDLNVYLACSAVGTNDALLHQGRFSAQQPLGGGLGQEGGQRAEQQRRIALRERHVSCARPQDFCLRHRRHHAQARLLACSRRIPLLYNMQSLILSIIAFILPVAACCVGRRSEKPERCPWSAVGKCPCLWCICAVTASRTQYALGWAIHGMKNQTERPSDVKRRVSGSFFAP